MFNRLNTSAFPQSTDFYIAEFEYVLQKITLCYKMMIDDGVKVQNSENLIRDKLLINYLKDNSIRNKIHLTQYLFDREVPEDNSIGRCDIKVQTQDTFTDTSAYFIIECKRLDSQNLKGITGLNAKYISNGIMRFVNKQYSTNKGLCGMIGFVVEIMDISVNINNINYLLKSNFVCSNTLTILTVANFIKDFDYQYYSEHKTSKSKKRIKLYHLMYDFSGNIKTS
ncbi:MAG: hypothetical protein COS68_01065 [Elusimicrobia bacterium CG06_land_8_20_14_3_00_38_11]|nr:MAG: hypothetical protein COS68_01065 [Elusimicrobia bacterium CG06_land_8_20_14_3_00_38_11]